MHHDFLRICCAVVIPKKTTTGNEQGRVNVPIA